MIIEFYHDVLCAWCYAFSPNLRKLHGEFPQFKIVHRCFALAPEPESITDMFGSKEIAEVEILKHLEAANEMDKERRICTDEMACRSFNYPYSMPGLIACKAAELIGGNEAHWNLFDRIQKAHFTEVLDINRQDVLLNCVRDVGLNLEKFLTYFNDDETKNAVLKDIEKAEEIGVYAVPSLVIGDEIISGFYEYEELKKLVFNISEEFNANNN